MMFVVVLLAVYGIVLGPLVYLLVKALSALSDVPEGRQTIEGMAASCFIAVLAALLLTRGIGVQGGIAVWIAFVALCAITIWLPPHTTLGTVVAAAVPPSLVLLGSALAIYGIPLWLQQGATAIISQSGDVSATISPTRVMGFTLFVAVISVPAIAIGIYARARLLVWIKGLLNLDPEKLGRVEKIINTSVRIGSALGAVFVLTQIK